MPQQAQPQTSSSATLTLGQQGQQQQQQQQSQETTQPTLVLRLNPKKDRPRVTWAEGVKDSRKNMKTSKKCCVFHKPREFGESDSESCSSEDEATKRDRPTRCSRMRCDCNTTYN